MAPGDVGSRGWSVALLGVAFALVAACQHPRPTPSTVPGSPEETGTEQPEKAGGAPEILSGKELEDVRVARAEELMSGRFAGVEVIPLSSGGISVRIRGGTSITGSNEPLYVLDGMPLEAGPGGALLGINPRDIARIEVLKDIAATSFYGVRGANGVVVITTKRGR